MSGKNRAFALAVATAALVGMSAPVASAATFSGPSGFNNDSVLNLSGNQLPVQACNLAPVAAVLGLLSPGNQTSAINTSCTQNPAETNTTTPAASSTPTAASSTPSNPSADTTSGFNNDSVLNLSGNQLPVQACNDVLNAVAALGILSSGAISAIQASSCTQNPAETNSSSAASSN